MDDELLAGSVQETVRAVVPASETYFGGDLTVKIVRSFNSAMLEGEVSV